VFGNMREQNRIEAVFPAVFGFFEVFGRERLETLMFREIDGMNVVIQTDAVSGEVFQVPADSAADFKGEAGLQPKQVLTIGGLDVDIALPPRVLLFDEAYGIGVVLCRLSRCGRLGQSIRALVHFSSSAPRSDRFVRL